MRAHAVQRGRTPFNAVAHSKFQAIEPNWKVPFVTKKRTPAKSKLLTACDEVLDLTDTFDLDAESDSRIVRRMRLQ